MLPFGIGFSEIVAIFIVLIIFVGPDGIPQAARTIAKVIKTIRGFIDEVRYSSEFDEVKREILDPIQEARRFNPKSQARDWVKRELENPIKETLSEEPVDSFSSADDYSADDSSANDSSADDSSADDSSANDSSETYVHDDSARDDSARDDSAREDSARDDSESDPPSRESAEDPDGEDPDDEAPPHLISAVDPLERGVQLSDEAESMADDATSDDVTS